MKQLIIREILWFFISLVLAVPLGFVFLSFLNLSSAAPTVNELEKLFVMQLLFISFVVAFIAIYVVRLVVYAVKKLLPGTDYHQP
jgi:hypothetical protein